MKRRVSLLVAICFFIIFGTAHASLIRYDIIGGVDTEGYNFSGYVDIDSDPAFSNGVLRYGIGKFLFESSAGTNYGSSGELLFRFANPETNMVYPGSSTARFYSDYIANYVEKENMATWSNAGTGVWFAGTESTYDAYSLLPDQITICSSLMAGGFNVNGYWGPDSLIALNRTSAPVPEPATLLLMGSGLTGFAGLRRKLRR